VPDVRSAVGLCCLLAGGAGTLLVPAARAAPAPNAPLPATPAALATALGATESALSSGIDAWRASGAARPPGDVTLTALYEQRIYRLLSARRALARATLARLRPPRLTFARDVITAHRELAALTPGLKTSVVHVGPAAPPADLLADYNAAQSRFGVPWFVLAAVNFVESAFGKLRSSSAAGAQGPMQFLPSEWRTYGLGGDVRDPHDAILGAANFLRAAGARRSVARALHAYNPSRLYVDAVLRYARRMRLDVDAFYLFYSWQVFVRTPSGVRRVTGPGLTG
jgi:membrane-bound lytic murein transglycosylase B